MSSLVESAYENDPYEFVCRLQSNFEGGELTIKLIPTPDAGSQSWTNDGQGNAALAFHAEEGWVFYNDMDLPEPLGLFLRSEEYLAMHEVQEAYWNFLFNAIDDWCSTPVRRSNLDFFGAPSD